MSKDLFFISDLHIGGDGLLNHCDFSEELIAFLQRLEQKGADTELIIVGDAFGLWEFTTLEGLEKLRYLADTHAELFAQFKRTGEKITITLLPGNHDYELACHPEYIPFFASYGIHLDPSKHIERNIAGRGIWIEHGNQHDSYNRFEHYGNEASTPLGYYITAQFVGGAGKISQEGRDNWLKDIQAVYPTEHIPHWVFSNYFYREMSPWLRYLSLPFLLLFSISVIVLALAILENQGLSPRDLPGFQWLQSLGGIGKLLEWVIMANTTIISFCALMALPAYFLIRDIKASLQRYKLIGNDHAHDNKRCAYFHAANAIFEQQPDTKVFIYGHTHDASLHIEDERAIINTGTWIKRLKRVSARARFLPDIYVPQYRLGTFHLYEEDAKLVISYHHIPKEAPQELSLLQRLLSFRRRPKAKPDIPTKTLL